MSFWRQLLHLDHDPGLPALKSAEEAFMAILYAVVTADKLVYESELDLMLAHCRARGQFLDKDLEALLEHINNLADQAGGAIRLIRPAADLLTETQREAAFITALDLAMADGTNQDEETALLKELEQVLHIKALVAEQARDVIRRKYL